MRKMLMFGAFATIIGLSVVGCGDDDGEDNADAGTGSGGTGGAADPYQECLDRSAETGLFCPEVTQCSCMHCVTELEDCSEDEGCMAIVDCASEHNCRGIACYTGPCMQVINDAPGGPTGPSAALATSLSDCVDDAQCPGGEVCN